MKKINISGVPETMLQTMYARAKETKKANPIIFDEKAVQIVESMDYDFSLADQDAPMENGVIARTILLDQMVSSFLDKHRNAVVINIACGLDTRCYRNEGKFAKWYNIDLPMTIDIRKRFMEEKGPKIYQIEQSAMDETWSEKIEYRDEPVLVVIEGITMYLTEKDVKKIFDIIAHKFQHATVLVETMNSFIVKHVREKSIDKSEAKFRWGIKNGRELENLINNFKFEADYSLAEGMAKFIPAYRILSKIPLISNVSNRITILYK